MKTNFLKSVTAGIVGLTLLGGCSSAMSKMGMHKCGGSCKAKEEANSCKGKKVEAKKVETKKVETK